MPSFFDEYIPYREHVDTGQYSHAVNGGVRLLSGVKNLAPNEYLAAHKGTPFYVMGFAAFLSHDYATATFLFDAALAEDLKNAPERNDTPAMLFMQLNDENPNQLAAQVVTAIKSQTDTLIRDYNGRLGSRVLTLNDVRNTFLKCVIEAKQPHLRTITTTFISFVAEWYYRSLLINLTEEGSREPFFMHLFKGCLLFESLLKANPTKSPAEATLGRILTHDLAGELGIPQLDIREQSFEAIVQSLVANMSVEASIECTGKTRNTLGHSLVWTSASLNAGTYDLLVKNIAAACIHAISTLYK